MHTRRYDGRGQAPDFWGVSDDHSSFWRAMSASYVRPAGRCMSRAPPLRRTPMRSTDGRAPREGVSAGGPRYFEGVGHGVA